MLNISSRKNIKREGAGSELITSFSAVLTFLVLSSAIYFGHNETLRDGVISFNNPLKPSYIYISTYLVTLYLILKSVQWASLIKSGIAVAMMSLAAIHLIWWTLSDHSAAVDRLFVLRLNVIAMALSFQVALSYVSNMTKVVGTVRLAIVFTSLINFTVVMLPNYLPYRMSAFDGRAAGLFDNPNMCANLLALMLPIASYGAKIPLKVSIYIAAIVGVFFTFSRSGMIILVMAIVLDILLQPGTKNFRASKLLMNVVIASGFVGALLLVIISNWSSIFYSISGNLNTDTLSRLSGGDMGSSAERIMLLRYGWELFSLNPLFGAGFGQTRTWEHNVSVHNMIVLFLAEFGVVGGVWYAYFIRKIFTFRARFGIVIGLMMLVLSVFSHSYFDLPYYVMVILIYWRLSIVSLSQSGREINFVK